LQLVNTSFLPKSKNEQKIFRFQPVQSLRYYYGAKSCLAWDDFGHMAVAGIAYNKLKPECAQARRSTGSGLIRAIQLGFIFSF
jgi:hypothetical protein